MGRGATGSWIIALLLSLAAHEARADRIVFHNGDRLKGTILSLAEGEFVFASEVAGRMRLSADRVRTFSTREEIEIHARDGSVLQANINESDGETITVFVEGEDDPRTLHLDEIASINPPKPKPWSGRVTAGFNFERGNTVTDTGDLSLNMTYRLEDDRINFRGRAESERDDGNTAKRRFRSTVKWDHFYRERRYFYTRVFGENDRVADLKLRFEYGHGIGVQWFDSDAIRLSTEAGVNWVRRTFRDGTRSEEGYAGRVAWDIMRRIAPGVRFFHEGSWTPSFEDKNDHLFLTETGIRTNLTQQFILETKVIWEYDGIPADEAKTQDVEYIISVGYEF
jgi:putative salt-induced outer membrane protein YdiY